MTTVIAVGRFFAALTARDVDLHSLDGSWFLVPAVLLGGVIATDRLTTRLGEPWAKALWGLATGSALIGWIAMGCAGLAAAALSAVLRGRALVPLPSAWLIAAMVVSVSVAIVLAMPVLVLSTGFLLRRCAFRAAGSWPPTFLTAVFSFGALQAGGVLHAPMRAAIGQGAAHATLVFWAVTAGWNVMRAWRRGTDASAASSLSR